MYLGAGSSITWDAGISPSLSSAYYWKPTVLDPSVPYIGTPSYQGTGASTITNLSGVASTSVLSASGTAQGYTSAGAVTSLTAAGITGGSVASDGSENSGAVVTVYTPGSYGSSTGTVAPIMTNTPVTPTTVTSIGGGTSGGGGGGASDTGLVNNASSINSGIAAAATSENAAIASGDNAITSQLTACAFLSPPSRDRCNHLNSISVGAFWNEHRPGCVSRTEDEPLPKGQRRFWQIMIPPWLKSAG